MHGLRANANLDTIDEEDAAPLPPPASLAQPALPVPRGFHGSAGSEQQTDVSFSPLNPLDYFDEQRIVSTARGDFNVYTGGSRGSIVYVFVHGAGYSALSFAEVVKFLKSEAFCVAVDLRSHGKSCAGPLDFDGLVQDLNGVFEALFTTATPAVLFGHSLGGSLITAIAPYRMKIEARVLIDISEAVALSSLPNMQLFLRKKPKVYQNANQMAHWLYHSKQLMRKTPCRIQAQAMVAEDGQLICDLSDTEKCWEQWFLGMNARFLADEKVWKMLLVSTMGKLDRDFEIAHMRGKMNVDVVQGCVHNLHEDNPVGFLNITTRFLRRLHLTEKMYNVPFDFKRTPLSDEREVPEEVLAQFFSE